MTNFPMEMSDFICLCSYPYTIYSWIYEKILKFSRDMAKTVRKNTVQGHFWTKSRRIWTYFRGFLSTNSQNDFIFWIPIKSIDHTIYFRIFENNLAEICQKKLENFFKYVNKCVFKCISANDILSFSSKQLN